VKTADEQYKYNEQQRNKQQQNNKNNNAALQSSLLAVPSKPSSDASKFLTRNKRGITDSITEFFFGSKQKNASPPPQSSFQKDDQKQVKTFLPFQLPEIRTQPNTVKRSSSIPNFNDPLYQTSLWYYKELNVTGAWNMGYTGKGVVLTVLDDGLEHMHPDLDLNYDKKASYDVNDQDQDPSPRYTRDNTNKHGTRCAGVISAEANNSVCIPGIAYHSNIGGIRMLDGTVNDQVEARSISHESNHVDIYSSSWGPDDDGKTVDGPGYLTQKAFQQGVKNGRKGKGNIYVWASGNGGRFVDSCAADGYANSIYTVSTSSASHEGRIPWYNEPCASTLATAYSSNNNNNDPKIATTDIRAKCTDQHTGTSAAAPMVAGIIALALEANPDLTWRDIQSLLIKTAKPGNLLAHDWRTNGVGRSYSHNFGYGLINAGDFVSAAIDQKGKQTAEQRECEIDLLPQRHAKVPHTDRISIRRLFIGNCKNGQDITNLEHVVLTVSLSFARRGDVEINLISPDGTLSKMHPRRPHDNKPTPYNNWPFMSVHFWDEQPYGSWSVEIKNAGPTRARGIVHKLKLKLYGTYNKRKHRELLGGYDSIAQKIQAQRNEEIDEQSTISTESFDSGWNRNGGGSSIGGSSASSRLDFSYFLVAMIVFFWFGKLR
jgi:subtilisin-like proprotein convertase family protein/subtilisin family serine protease